MCFQWGEIFVQTCNEKRDSAQFFFSFPSLSASRFYFGTHFFLFACVLLSTFCPVFFSIIPKCIKCLCIWQKVFFFRWQFCCCQFGIAATTIELTNRLFFFSHLHWEHEQIEREKKIKRDFCQWAKYHAEDRESRKFMKQSHNDFISSIIFLFVSVTILFWFHAKIDREKQRQFFFSFLFTTIIHFLCVLFYSFFWFGLTFGMCNTLQHTLVVIYRH